MKMRQEIELELSDNQEPVARVPCDAAWDLIEFLANQRAHVQYSFQETRVVVRFHHMSMEAAKQLLEMWSRSGEREEAFRSVRSESVVHA